MIPDLFYLGRRDIKVVIEENLTVAFADTKTELTQLRNEPVLQDPSDSEDRTMRIL